MKRDDFTMTLDLGNELIIDNFAGGGGTSTGLEQAFGRPVDIAINHDPEALAMHAANHPQTRHLCESVWDVDPIKITNNQPVGLVWLSPDCKHFSKAKGGKPVEKKIRGLAWVTLRWAAKCKPRVIMLENVSEFKTWGPLLIDADGNSKPDPSKKGKTFESFIRQLEGHGYEVQHNEMRGCDHDTPTIRKRFFLVARRDGIPIQWPTPTHGAPDSLGVKAGKLKPYRTAAECIDFSLDCPSIFERKKPLAEATLRRIAKGIMRYVVDAAEPFIVGQGGPIYSGKPVSTSQPFGTLTSENHRSVVMPHIVPVTHQGGDRTESINEPFRTITGAHRGEKALSTATLVQIGYGERKDGWRCKHCTTEFDVEPTCGCTSCGHEDDLIRIAGQAPRALDIEKPLGTVVSGASKHALVSAFLTEHANASNQRVMSADEPLRTVCAQVKGGHFSMVAAHITKFRTGATGSAIQDPVPTITAGPKENPAGCPHALGIVTAHIQRDMGQSVGHAADAPLGTVMAGGGGKSALVTAHIESLYGQKGNEARSAAVDEPLKTVTASSRHALMTSNLVKLRGTSTASGTDEPLGTVSAGGQHHAEVRAFLLSYYGTDQNPQIDGPLATVTSRDRFGLVTIHGQDYQIVDIGLRMLAPRELFRAQGFPDSYIIGDDPAQGLTLTKSAQVRMCGNSVCPPMAKALILANFSHEKQIARVA